MRRKDKEITDRQLISDIISKCQVCRLGLACNHTPYIVPVSFGYDGDAIYFHTAKEGKKIDYIAANSSVCFEFEHGVQVLPDGSSPCKWSFSFQSVIGYGNVHELTAPAAKAEGLHRIMAQYSNRRWAFGDKSLDTIRVWKITIDSMTGKQSRDHPSAVIS
jgi:nitroimidazol reductase NimA-like FMN-containing flavoprotein (pyridoxamine 5'-phosphate oxidase superfamily)